MTILRSTIPELADEQRTAEWLMIVSCLDEKSVDSQADRFPRANRPVRWLQ